MTPEQATALMAPLSGAELQSLAAEVGRADRKSVAEAIGIGRGTLAKIVGSARGNPEATGETNMKIRVWLAHRAPSWCACGSRLVDIAQTSCLTPALHVGQKASNT